MSIPSAALTLIVGALLVGCGDPPGADKLPLETVAEVVLPGEPSRFDYQSIDPEHGLLFIADLGGDAVVVVDTEARSVLHGVPNISGSPPALVVRQPREHGVVEADSLRFRAIGCGPPTRRRATADSGRLLLILKTNRTEGGKTMRVATAFNRLLKLEGAFVRKVNFAEEGVVVEIALRKNRKRVCSGCGHQGKTLAIHDHRRTRWRHLDLGAQICMIECELRRYRCERCRGVRFEAVGFADAAASHTRDFCDVVAYLAQQATKTVVAKLMRVGWSTVSSIVERAVAERLGPERLRGLVFIGVDEISWRKHHRYLTTVVDQIGGNVVWCAEGRSAATLQRFFTELGPDKQTIMAVSIDMSAGYEKAIREAIPHARICFDPFHVVALASKAVDQVRREQWNALGRRRASGSRAPGGRY